MSYTTVLKSKGAGQRWVRTLFAKFWIFIRYSVGLHWILWICLSKFWKVELLGIEIWKPEIRQSAVLHSTYNDGVFKFRLVNYVFTTLMMNAVLFHNEWLRRKTMGNVNCPGLFGVKSLFLLPLLLPMYFNALCSTTGWFKLFPVHNMQWLSEHA